MSKPASLQQSIMLTALFLLLIWWIKLSETLFGWNLHQLGVYPHELGGLIGIITAPLIHGSWLHIFSNTLPILLLGSMLLYGYPKSRWWTVAIIWLVSGLGVWLFGRESFHFGASGLAHGLFFYLLIGGILRRDKRSMVFLMIAFFMYGSMTLTIFPREPAISFEYHLFGAVGGVICALLFRHWDPKPLRRVYAWELEPEDQYEEDPIIGDQWKMEPERESKEPGRDD
jgi:membrane associated rhomboid family serine protease